MKSSRYKKVLGLAVGERSLLAAELVMGERPEVRRLAEFVYPAEVAPDGIADLAADLQRFLREQQMTARATVVGIPARWLVVKPKEVPPADPATLAPMLRLQAEADFSTELKDLVYDFAGDSRGGEAKTVLLMATPRKYVEAAVALCDGAGLSAITVTPSAMALGEATGRALAKNTLVLAVGPGGAEMTSQRGAVAGALRHVGGATPRPPFSELRRAVSSLGVSGAGGELFLWDGADLDAAAMGTQLGLLVQRGDLPALGVTTTSATANGEGRRYAAAVALALSAMVPAGPSVDFLHSRLAPVTQRRVPRWAIISVVGIIALIAGGTYAYRNLLHQEADVAALQAQLNGMQGQIAAADDFVSKVSFARAWHGGEPRYLACVRDLTLAMPNDGQTYATSLVLHETLRTQIAGAAPVPAAPGVMKGGTPRTLAGVLYGRTADQERVLVLVDRMRHISAFTDVKLGGWLFDASRANEVSFSITFTYMPPNVSP